MKGRQLLSRFDPAASWEINEGDYREELRKFARLTSTGMFCHVGPRGLEPYVRKVRQLVGKGDPHHGLMTPTPMTAFASDIVRAAFNKGQKRCQVAEKASERMALP